MLPHFNRARIEGRRIGLFGGSFNPAHEGHGILAKTALERLQLDEVWWMVSPQNPLKDRDETADFHDRLARTRKLARHPRFVVTDIENRLATRTTAQTLAELAPLLEAGRFVWLMGADSFAGLHHWNDWHCIPKALAIAVFDRPGWTMKALSCPAATIYRGHQLDTADAPLLPFLQPPCWVFIPMPHQNESSTRLRNSKNKTPA